ncbi:chromate transporter [Methylobacterium sp. UNC378MF]|uniref:chromate transporter n=1 Tax=Methylobacterium sp. UNC378MF TaxID=1502748 RepID=UPI000890E5E7|nr:chromate transporter [Methylobacterium sp. UNC378MF]SDA21154.1 chromate transporter [Methylobacterium sp. UNC378MF]
MPTSDTAEPLPAPDAAPPGLLELFWLFNRLTLVSFGGGLTAWARKLIVEDKRWLDDAEFLSAYALARVLPGANQANFAIYVGHRFRGVSGAAAALLGLTLVPFWIVLGLAWAYFHSGAVPAVQDVLRGVTAAAVGLALSAGLKAGEGFARRPAALAFIAAAFLGSVLLHLPLIAVLAILAPPAFLLAWRHLHRRGADGAAS